MTNEHYDKFLSGVADLVPGVDALYLRDLVLDDDLVGHTRKVLIIRAAERIFHNAGDLSAATTVRDLYERCTAAGATSDGIVKASRHSFETAVVRLRPILPEDELDLYEAALDPRSSHRWRLRGRNISPEAFHEMLHDQVLAQFIVEDIESREAQGLVMAYRYDPDAQHASFAIQRIRKGRPGSVMFGTMLLFNYLFTRFDIRKLYAEVPDYNRSLIEGIGIARVEAELKDHFWFDGAFVDKVVFSIARDDFFELSSPWFYDEAA